MTDNRISEWHEPVVVLDTISGERHRCRYHIASLYVEIGKSWPWEWWESGWRRMADRVWPWGQPDDPSDVPDEGWPPLIAAW